MLAILLSPVTCRVLRATTREDHDGVDDGDQAPLPPADIGASVDAGVGAGADVKGAPSFIWR